MPKKKPLRELDENAEGDDNDVRMVDGDRRASDSGEDALTSRAAVVASGDGKKKTASETYTKVCMCCAANFYS